MGGGGGGCVGKGREFGAAGQPSARRIPDGLERFFDENTELLEIGAAVAPEDPLRFRDSKRYKDRLAQAQKAGTL